MAFKRLIRFVPIGNTKQILLGEPVKESLDVGKAIRNGESIEARIFSGTSALNPGDLTDNVEKVERILSPLSQAEIGSIRCIGLNVSLLPLPFLRYISH